MRRFLLLLAVAFCILPSCGKDVVLSVDATITFRCTDGMNRRFGPVTYEGFAHNKLKSDDIYAIFDDLRKNVTQYFRTAEMELVVYDKISDELLWTRNYRFTEKEGPSRRGYTYEELE